MIGICPQYVDGYSVTNSHQVRKITYENEKIRGKCQRDCTPTRRKTEGFFLNLEISTRVEYLSS